jgi:putative molybdopterin biosynthesis protein
LLDYLLEQQRIDPGQVNGYEREEYTHLAVAAAVASGSADCGMGIRSAALALGLGFIPITHERYDLVIPTHAVDLPMMQHVLALLHDAEFRAAVATQPGYDVAAMGQRVPY